MSDPDPAVQIVRSMLQDPDLQRALLLSLQHVHGSSRRNRQANTGVGDAVMRGVDPIDVKSAKPPRQRRSFKDERIAMDVPVVKLEVGDPKMFEPGPGSHKEFAAFPDWGRSTIMSPNFEGGEARFFMNNAK